VKKRAARPVWPRKTAAEPLAPARDEVSVGCAVSDFLLRPAQIASGKYRKSKTWLYSALP
jgi:hypothetical protein